MPAKGTCDKGMPPPDPPPVAHRPVVTVTRVALTAEELIALFDAACYVGAYRRPAPGAANVDITPEGIVRAVGALDAARAKLAVAIATEGR